MALLLTVTTVWASDAPLFCVFPVQLAMEAQASVLGGLGKIAGSVKLADQGPPKPTRRST
jgi:hypothetical protein